MTIVPALRSIAEGIARTVEVVGIGSDMQGLLSEAAFAEALLATGFATADAAKVLGGNFARVLAATLPA